MKCPGCGYNTFNDARSCKKCGRIFRAIQLDKNKSGSASAGSVTGGISGHEGQTPDSEEQKGPCSARFKHYHVEGSGFTEELSGYGDDGCVRTHKCSGDLFPGLAAASVSSRLAAFIIDLAIVAVVAFITLTSAFYAAGLDFMQYAYDLKLTAGLAYLILCILFSTYFFAVYIVGANTIGKTLAGIKVVSEEGEPVSPGNAFIRWVGYFISLVPLSAGFLWVLRDRNGQTWHDKLANTYVVKD